MVMLKQDNEHADQQQRHRNKESVQLRTQPPLIDVEPLPRQVTAFGGKSAGKPQGPHCRTHPG